MSERIALFGDIHANAAALEAVLGAIDDAGIRRGVCTGDLVMRGAAPGACIDMLRRRDWPVAMGNTDHKVATRAPRAPDHPKARRVGSRSWTSAHISAEQRDFLAGLPSVIRLDVGGLRVVVTHADPEDPSTAFTAVTPDDELVRLARRAGADVVVMGHTHRQVAREAGGAVFVNPGSVGEAWEGDNLSPRWAWLEVDGAGARVHLERVDLPLRTVRER